MNASILMCMSMYKIKFLGSCVRLRYTTKFIEKVTIPKEIKVFNPIKARCKITSSSTKNWRFYFIFGFLFP